MTECFRCGKEQDSSRFFDVISDEGIVKICPECQDSEKLPVLRKPTTYQLKEAEAGGTVYERLSSIAGLNAKEHLKKFHPDEAKKVEEMKKTETSLRELVDKNYESKIETKIEDKKIKEDLVNNFHWIIMRARRHRKLTQAQFAKEIGESQNAIKMAEQGVLPEDEYRLIRKIQAFLGIKLMKKDLKTDITAKSEELFDGISSKELTIGDLKDMNTVKESQEIVEEMEEDVELNTEKKSFFNKIFKRREKQPKEVEESIILDEEVDMDK